MKESLKELFKAETRVADFTFISEVVQRGRRRPQKYRHFIELPPFLYSELRNNGVIDTEFYIVDESAFFEFSRDSVKISFICLHAAEDLHRKIDKYLIEKMYGSYPIKRGGIFF
jgi:hypothetical protein